MVIGDVKEREHENQLVKPVLDRHGSSMRGRSTSARRRMGFPLTNTTEELGIKQSSNDGKPLGVGRIYSVGSLHHITPTNPYNPQWGNFFSLGRNIQDYQATGIADTSIHFAPDYRRLNVHPRKCNNEAASSALSWDPQSSSPPKVLNGNNGICGAKAFNSHEEICPKNGVHNNVGSSNVYKYNIRARSSNADFSTPPIPSPPKTNSNNNNGIYGVEVDGDTCQKENVHEDNNVVCSDDSADAYDSDFDSDASPKSHETRKNSKWFKSFFERLDGLSLAEVKQHKWSWQWRCPACQGGSGATNWFRGVQDLVTHAKAKSTRRVKLHREFAELLEEELSRKRASVTDVGQTHGKWKGFREEAEDHGIVWPPMVIIMNTNINNDDKCIGMGSEELLEHFRSYAAVKAQHSYGPQGHRGMSVLIFESSVAGYLEAERLHKDFVEQGLGRNAWESCPALVLPSGDRQLYGFMAVKEDLDIFNRHCQGRGKLSCEIKSYKEDLVCQIRKISEENQQLICLKTSLAEAQTHVNILEESVQNLTKKLHLKSKEASVLRQNIQLQHEKNKEELDFQEKFFKERIQILEARKAEEEEHVGSEQIEEHGLSDHDDAFDEWLMKQTDETAATSLIEY